MNLQVIFEDEYIICVNKPNNVLVHHAFHAKNVADEKSLLQLLDEQIAVNFIQFID